MKRILLSTILPLLAIMAIQAQVYLCGAVNNWDITKTLEFARNDNGLYFLKVNFASGEEFKISTVKTESDNVSEAWAEFDKGVLGLNGDAVLNKWLTLTAGYAPNIKAPAKGEYTLYVDLSTNKLFFSDGETGPEPDKPWSGTLPVLFINTNDNLPVDSKEVYRKGTYYLDPMGVEGIEAIGSVAEPLTLQIKGRGNYTWTGFDKKPYRLKLDEKAPLMGMKKSKHFAILAHADDNLGHLRNEAGFALSRKLGLPWTPASKPLEVVLNGDYIGLYWLTETIRVDKDRVNVVEQKDLATTDVDGGWLVEIDNYDSDPHVTVTAADGYNIWFTYKSPEELSSEQESYLESQMTAINTAVDKGDFKSLSELVDIDCLARYYMVQQLMQDRESFHGSCYLNRQRGESNKWMFGPVWDFGNAFMDGTGTDPVFIGQANFYQVWIPGIYKMDGFVKAVTTVWAGQTGKLCNDVISELKPIAESIVDAAKADAARWPQYAQTDIMAKYDRLSTYLANSCQWAEDEWKSGSVTDMTLEHNGAVRYFNLQGIELQSPVAGDVVVRLQGSHADKIIYNE
ncbi:MAG: CotH kinase family protein [Muribaculaceae bacterium]|nr:CotH kinase family protein [Muribaculaceae bacterium]